MTSRQPTHNPLTLATVFYLELIAGAHSFFGIGALLVDSLPFCPTAELPPSKTDGYCYDTTYKPLTIDYS